jgi:hypothetical protein
MSDYTGGDLDLRGLRRGAYVIVGGIVCALVAAALMLRERGPAANTPPHPFTGAAPLLQPAPQPERAAYFEEKRRVLDSYGWVDRQAGIAHIPLDEAMTLLAARGGTAPAPTTRKERAAIPGRTPPRIVPGEDRR